MIFRYPYIRSVFLVVAIALSMLVGTSDNRVLAQETDAAESNQAGLVVYYDEDSIDYHVVDLPEDGIDAVELLTLTDHDLEVQPFGELGEAVCSINSHGCPGSDCFCEANTDPAYFWQFYAYDENQWVPQLEGGSQHTVEAGEILGWIWTEGNPELPDVTFDILDERATSSSDAQEESDENATDFVPYIALFGLLFGLVALVGIRRLRQNSSP